MAAILVMKIIHSNYSKYGDVDEGKRDFDTVVRMFKRSSAEDNDLGGKSSKILTNIWSLHHSSLPKNIKEEPKLNIKTRLGASLLHDSLWTWREEFGGQRDALKTRMHNLENRNSAMVPGTPAHHFTCASGEHCSIVDDLPLQNLDTMPALEETELNFDMQDMDWLWDVGIPSFLPPDFGSAQQSPPGWQSTSNFF